MVSALPSAGAAAPRRVAVMQPYFLPYIGYFQLMAAVDVFVVYDDVAFINRGWINRNRILSGGQPQLFTVPLVGASQNRLICELTLAADPRWRDKLLRTVEQAYARAPQRDVVLPLLDKLLRVPTSKLDEFLLFSLRELAAFLGLAVEIRPSSRLYDNAHLKAQDRILDICRREQAGIYVNAMGGRELYASEAFERAGMKLNFLQPRPTSYAQGLGVAHVPWLSILDVLMHNERATVRALLDQADLA